jgi:ribosomal protein S24E
MEVKVLEDKENFLFNRKEVKLIAKGEKTPSYDEAAELLSSNFKAEKDNIVVRGVMGKFGRDTFLVSASIYNTKEDKDKFEPKKVEDKKEGEAEQAPAPAEQPAPEEKKEEPKPEEKPTEDKKEEEKKEESGEAK